MKKILILSLLFLFGLSAQAYTKDEAIKMLYEKNRDPSSSLFLADAINKQDIEIVELYLIADQVDLNEKVIGSTPLFQAVFKGNKDIVKLLIDTKKIDINEKVRNVTPLMMAIYCKHPDIALMLLANGADPKIVCSGKTTALFYAVKNGQTEVVKKILETPGINLEEKPRFRKPLKTTAKNKYPEIYELLISYEKQEAARKIEK